MAERIQTENATGDIFIKRHPADQIGHKMRTMYWRAQRRINPGVELPDKTSTPDKIIQFLQRRKMFRDRKSNK